MAAHNHVENPFEYALERIAWAFRDAGRAVVSPPVAHAADAPVEIRKVTLGDLKAALKEGAEDLGAGRMDVLFLAVIYPLAGLVLARLAFSYEFLPLVFPLLSGFAIVGPVAAVGLYQVSRRHEAGEPVSALTPLEVLRSPAIGSIVALGLLLTMLFLAWLAAAWAVYSFTLGQGSYRTMGQFAQLVLTTPQGWAMIVVGCAVGAVFAVLSFAISVVSFPLLLDRDVGVGRAMSASIQAVRRNPATMAAWAAFIATALVLASLPALVGLIFVVPWLGHATWHLYRRVVA